MNRTLFSVFLAAAAAWGALTPAGGWGEDAIAAKVKNATKSMAFESTKISGSLNSTYQFRSYDGREDNDLYEFLSLRVKDIYKDYIDGAFSMSWHEDLDGVSRLNAGEKYDPYQELDLSAGARFRYYAGYIDFKKVIFDDSVLRVGRQYLEEIDNVHFDGASYRFSPSEPVDISLFGGQPITYYSSLDGEAVYGTNLQFQLARATRAAVRYYRYDADSYRDDLSAVEVWHAFQPNLQSHAKFTLLDAEPYMFSGDLFARVETMDLDAIVHITRLMNPVSDHTINFDPYFPLLNGYEPFTYGSLNLTKGLGQYVSLVGGFDLREADSAYDPVSDYLNKDYWRVTGGVEFYPTEQLTLSVNGEYWDVDSKDRFTGITGEVEYRPCKKWTLSAGVDYGEYVQVYRDEFLYLFGQDETFRITPDAVTYYARVRWKPAAKIYAGASFEVEDNDWDNDNWYSFRLELGSRF
ncbi:MAG: hypothetical protein AB1656_16405 [Candidatus Omnitrophota bacterium]